jgi:CheY-like chemotaxis protein
MHLLIVDDDVTAAPLMRAALKTEFQVSTEASGAAALFTAAELRPDLILLDLFMPNVDGFEVLRQLRTHPATASTPVICMSGAVEEEVRERARGLGAVGYFQKPLDLKKLTADIRSLSSSLSIRLESPGAKTRFSIAYNAGEKYRQIFDDLKAEIGMRQCVLLTLAEGEALLPDDMKQAVENETLLFLQILPSTLAKFPFLYDLSPIMDDIRSFTNKNLEQTALYVDDPALFLLSEDGKTGHARIHAVKELFTRPFGFTRLYASRDGGTPTTFLNEMAKLFTQA